MPTEQRIQDILNNLDQHQDVSDRVLETEFATEDYGWVDIGPRLEGTGTMRHS